MATSVAQSNCHSLPPNIIICQKLCRHVQAYMVAIPNVSKTWELCCYVLVGCRGNPGFQAVWLFRHLPRLQVICGSSHHLVWDLFLHSTVLVTCFWLPATQSLVSLQVLNGIASRIINGSFIIHYPISELQEGTYRTCVTWTPCDQMKSPYYYHKWLCSSQYLYQGRRK